MKLLQKLSIAAAATVLIFSTAALATPAAELEQSATQTQTSSSQIKEEQKLGYCWFMGIWIC